MATDPNRPGHGGAASSPLISSLSGVDGEGAPYAPPPSPISAAPASSSTVSAATSAPSTGANLGETSGITGHRLGQEYASVPSSSGIAFVSFGLLPREVLSTDLRLDLGSVFAASHMTNSSSAGQHMAFGYANSSYLSSPSHDLVQAQQQQSGRRPEAPRTGCPTRSRISGGSSSGSQLDHLPPPADAGAGAGAAVADMVLATTAPPPPTTSSAQAQAQQADVTRDMWLACAAPKSGRLPAVGSLVYYFPDGHAEQCPSRPPEPLPGRIFLCKVTDVHLYATTWNEPVATIFLVPVAADDHALQLQAPADPGAAPDQNLVSFVKPLTNTDAVKNQYRFIVPKKDAAAGVLPHLELNDNVLLRIKDLKGKEWVFNYTWKEHTRMFRSGWMKFTDDNRLVTGDNVVFMRRMDDGEMFMGVRRTLNRPAPGSVEEVINAVWRAARREPFHVKYRSRQDGDEFVVPRDVVDDGLRARFAPGMVVNFVWAVEEGKLPTIGPQGKVISIESYASSIWRMIQVEWASSAEMNRHVNFWQIRPVLGESSSQATVKLQDDSQAPHKNSANSLQLPDGTNQLQHKKSASSSSIEEPPSFRLFGQTMTPGVPPRRDSRGPSLQPIASDEDEQVPTMRKRLEALLPDNI